MSASSICRAFQDTYGWTDDTLLALLWEWIDDRLGSEGYASLDDYLALRTRNDAPETIPVRVEYDTAYFGGDYDSDGEIAIIYVSAVEDHLIQQAFKAQVGEDPIHIVHWTADDADEWLEEGE